MYARHMRFNSIDLPYPHTWHEIETPPTTATTANINSPWMKIFTDAYRICVYIYLQKINRIIFVYRFNIVSNIHICLSLNKVKFSAINLSGNEKKILKNKSINELFVLKFNENWWRKKKLFDVMFYELFEIQKKKFLRSGEYIIYSLKYFPIRMCSFPWIFQVNFVLLHF